MPTALKPSAKSTLTDLLSCLYETMSLIEPLALTYDSSVVNAYFLLIGRMQTSKW